MHVMAPQPAVQGCPIFFNVDSSVGNNGMNSNRTDILLVQFLVRKLGQIATNIPTDKRARMAKVVVDGLSGPNTIDGIRAVQELMRDTKAPGTVVDGRISSARGYTYASSTGWTIVNLNAALRSRSQSIWPRLHDLPDCPGELKSEFQKCL